MLILGIRIQIQMKVEPGKGSYDGLMRITILVSLLDFQSRGSRGFLLDKAHHLVEHLVGSKDIAVEVLSHIESPRLPAHNPYQAKEQHRRWSDLALLGFNFIALALGTNINKKVGLKCHLQQSWLQARKRFWSRLFSRSNPRFLLGIGLSDSEILAARELGIPSFEIQHGDFTVGDLQTYWPRQRPDFFLVWGEGAAKIVESFSIKPIMIPPPLTERIDRDCFEADVLAPLTHSSKSAQPGSLGTVSRELHQLLEAIVDMKLKLLFRPHPVFPRKSLQGLERSLGSVYSTSNFSDAPQLYQFLSKAPMLIVDNSSIWFDGLRAGNILLIVDIDNWERVKLIHPAGENKQYFYTPNVASLKQVLAQVHCNGLDFKEIDELLVNISWGDWNQLNAQLEI